jgi:TatD DNase family protein
MYIETHCHLDYLEQLPIQEIIKKSQEVGIDKIITIAVDPDNQDLAFELAIQNDMVYCSQGIHPHDAIKANTEVLEKIKLRQLEKKVLAVGEIGLDYYYNHSPRNIQISIFEKQLQIAIETNKPVIIHSRDADDDMMDILKNCAKDLTKKGVIHSFTSGKKLAETALDLGFFLGFNGIITFKNAHNVREIVDLCPLERMLLETDAPFLTPVPHRGKENAPFYLPFVAEKITELKNVNIDMVIATTTTNAENLFFN